MLLLAYKGIKSIGGIINKKILLTGARTFIALDLARGLKKMGHQVFVADPHYFHVCKFSNAVTKSFQTPIAREHPEKYINSLITIIEKEKIDLLIPIYEEIMYISQGLDRLKEKCKVLCSSFDVLHSLHNKHEFIEKLKKFDMDYPKTFLIKNKKDLKNKNIKIPSIAKQIYSRASLSVKIIKNKKDLNKISIDKKNPTILQEFIAGENICSYSLCNNGRVLASVVYPVEFTVDGSSCISFRSIDCLSVERWIKEFVKKENFSGHIAFDFIQRDDGKLFAIECNPRTTLGIHLLISSDNFIKTLVMPDKKQVFIKNGVSRQITTAMLMYGWRSHQPGFLEFLKRIFFTKDIIFSIKDLKPFLFQPILYIFYFLKSFKHKFNLPKMFTHDVDWNG